MTEEVVPNGTGRINDMAVRLTATESRLDRRLDHQDEVLDRVETGLQSLTVDVAILKKTVLDDEKSQEDKKQDKRANWGVKAILGATVLGWVLTLIIPYIH